MREGVDRATPPCGVMRCPRRHGSRVPRGAGVHGTGCGAGSPVRAGGGRLEHVWFGRRQALWSRSFSEWRERQEVYCMVWDFFRIVPCHHARPIYCGSSQSREIGVHTPHTPPPRRWRPACLDRTPDCRCRRLCSLHSGPARRARWSAPPHHMPRPRRGHPTVALKSDDGKDDGPTDWPKYFARSPTSSSGVKYYLLSKWTK